MAVNIPGVTVIVVFYLLVLGTGIWASLKSKRQQRKSAATGIEMILLGNRQINWKVGWFTMTGMDHTGVHKRHPRKRDITVWNIWVNGSNNNNNCWSWPLKCLCVFICPVATAVGGGFIIGIAEMVYTPSMGLIYAVITLLAYAAAFVLGKNLKLYLSRLI